MGWTGVAVDSDSSKAVSIIMSEPDIFFFAVGDFGHSCPNTVAIAAAMNEYAEKNDRKPDFVLALGDNFYPEGVINAEDPQFQHSWEHVFLIHQNLRVPWKVVLGNHDYMGNYQAQIEFTNHPKNPEGIWQLPAPNYSFKHAVPGRYGQAFTAEFFALDTNGCQGHVRRSHPDSEQALFGYVADLRGALALSNADWKIVFAHHPLHTAGVHHGMIGRCLRDDSYSYGGATRSLRRPCAARRWTSKEGGGGTDEARRAFSAAVLGMATRRPTRRAKARLTERMRD